MVEFLSWEVFVLGAFLLAVDFVVVVDFGVVVGFLIVLQNFFLFRLDRISLSVTSSSVSSDSSDSVT